MDLLIATSNQGKLREYQRLLDGIPQHVLSLVDAGLAEMDVEENGTTVLANATIKSSAYAQASGLLSLADDTGLFVDALNGAPGVYPARWGGAELTMAQRRAKMLAALDGIPDERRSARFVCVIAVTTPEGETQTVEGICEGRIARNESHGEQGFGYDAIFIPLGYDRPWSLVPLDEKNRISHRGTAARKLIPILQRLAANG